MVNNSFKIIGRAALLSLAFVLLGCGTSPPSRSDDLCQIFHEMRGWRAAADAAAERWGSPVATLLAIIRHESAFVAEARPPRRRWLGFLPGPRPSSAYGYPQALDGTWDDYTRATGRGAAERDDFADAVDFVGWYNDQSWRKNGIAKNDSYRLYLAYFSGHAGYARGRYRGNRALQATARRVAATATRYAEQLRVCRLPPASSGWWF